MTEFSSERIERAAQEVLRLAGALSVPVDLDRVAAALNVRVREEDFEDQVSGVLIVKGRERHIMVNKAHPVTRRRFSIAHELGHLRLHDNNADQVFIDHQIRVYHRVGEASAEVYKRPEAMTNARQEREANMFAAALLMPEALLKRAALERDMWDEFDVATLAKTFGVSEQAMSIRLQQLRVVSPDIDPDTLAPAAASRS